MRIVSAAKHAAVQQRLARTIREREAADELVTKHVATIQRLRTELDQARDANPNTPLQQSKPPVGDAELKRRLDLALRAVAELQQRLDDMQISHIADTKELHDLRQGVAS